MFRESYQSGKAVEILNPKDKNFKHGKSMQPLYDQTAKSYVFSLETHMSKISLPSNENEKLGLVQPYLILQLFVPGSHNFSFELKITDRSGSKRRLLFTTATKDLVINPLNCRIPTEIQKNTWINLCVNIESFANFYFGNNGYRSLDNITIFAYCKLRNVFTLRNTILDCSTNSYEPIPKSLEFLVNVNYTNHILKPEHKIDVRNTTQTEPFRMTHSSIRTNSPWNRSSIVTPLVRPHKSAPLNRKNLNLPPRPNKSGTANITPRAKNESAETDQKSIIRIRTGKTNVSPVMSRTIAPSKENTPRGVNKPPKYKETVKEINLYSKFQSHNTHEVDGEEVEEDIITESLEMDKADGNSITKTPNKVPMSFNGKSETETNEMPKPFYFDKGMWEALQHREFSPALGKDQENPDQKSEELKELAYDGVLKCFYSPATQEYYNVRY